VEIWWPSNLRPLRIGEEKKRRRKKKKIITTAAKYNGLPITMGGHNNGAFARP